jgi:hypothetical protein
MSDQPGGVLEHLLDFRGALVNSEHVQDLFHLGLVDLTHYLLLRLGAVVDVAVRAVHQQEHAVDQVL